jgi:holliday junction DNA helicase RuvA
VISRIRGTLLGHEDGRVEVATPGGVVYQVEVPTSVAAHLPPPDQAVELLTLQVIRDDAHHLFGFLATGERTLFQRVMGVQKVGPRMALNLLSTYSAPRLARALAEKDIAALSQVSGVGKKTAERLALELWDKVEDLELAGAEGDRPADGAQEAIQALMALGMGFQSADRAVRAALDGSETMTTEALVRKALTEARKK